MFLLYYQCSVWRSNERKILNKCSLSFLPIYYYTSVMCCCCVFLMIGLERRCKKLSFIFYYVLEQEICNIIYRSSDWRLWRIDFWNIILQLTTLRQFTRNKEIRRNFLPHFYVLDLESIFRYCNDLFSFIYIPYDFKINDFQTMTLWQ